MKWLLVAVLALLLIGIGLFATRSYLSRANPPELGLLDGRLRACPASPNCVCSEGSSGEHQIAAFPYRGDRASTEAALRRALGSLERSHVLQGHGDYWHVQSVSALFRFIDDVEFRFDDAAQLVQVRSASRVGYSDLGVNRKRIEHLRERYQAD